jgi:hypothetical protein
LKLPVSVVLVIKVLPSLVRKMDESPPPSF